MTGPAESGHPDAGRAPGGQGTVVWKFGGTSVGDVDRLRAVAARLVAANRAGTRVVAVLSAMGGSTDDLVRQAHQVAAVPEPRELDALLSVGEGVSCALAAIAVHELGGRAVSLTAAQAGIYSDASHGNARLLRVDPGPITAELDRGRIVLVTGYQAVSPRGDVTTLGRGGSDASAIAVASALGLRECVIFTDVPGVFTADPRVVPEASKLTDLGHDEMLQLADSGAKVLQTRAVELAAAHGIDIHVRSSLSDEPGTLVGGGGRGATAVDGGRVSGIAHFGHDPIFHIPGTGAGPVSAALAKAGIAVGSVIVEAVGVRFTAPGAETARVLATLAEQGLPGTVRDDLGSVSVVGSLATDRVAVAATVMATLQDEGVTVQLFTTSPNRVSAHVPATDVATAARALHRAFGLGADQALEVGVGG
ncbi:aspartate kinase [Actinokineospora baliensis]|uniref:aspartate kinase n=1 Tax=Actinokineospora baliensis TaxID=547056 RepID=UPI0019592A68|nr:aspartate kinase [Actinokineospora baliensis]MBM7773851.1 aspartate kinase [Actinokineospora baliensis]